VSVEKRPNRRWRARYRDASGKEHARHFDRKVDAERWEAAMKAAVAKGDWIDPGRSKVTVGEWASRWLDAQVQLKPSTRARYTGVLRTQVLPRWGRVPLSAVTHADVAEWVARLSADQLAPRSVHKAHRVLSLLLDLAVRDRRLTTQSGGSRSVATGGPCSAPVPVASPGRAACGDVRARSGPHLHARVLRPSIRRGGGVTGAGHRPTATQASR
jgi:hypothetical protein